MCRCTNTDSIIFRTDWVYFSVTEWTKVPLPRESPLPTPLISWANMRIFHSGKQVPTGFAFWTCLSLFLVHFVMSLNLMFSCKGGWVGGKSANRCFWRVVGIEIFLKKHSSTNWSFLQDEAELGIKHVFNKTDVIWRVVGKARVWIKHKSTKWRKFRGTKCYIN